MVRYLLPRLNRSNARRRLRRLTVIEKRLVVAMALFAAVICLGAFGYVLIEGWNFGDALYMTVITVSTVGFGEVKPLDGWGKVLTGSLIVFGVLAFIYLTSMVANYLIAGELQGLLERRTMENRIDDLRDHYIVCGYGRMGQEVCYELQREGLPLAVIDQRSDAVDRAITDGYLAMQGDAEDDDVLIEAGVEYAHSLITVVDDDAANLMVTLSARTINSGLLIVARAERPGTEKKLRAAGASEVLCPQLIGGKRMAHMAVRPNVVDFLELVTSDEDVDLPLAEFVVAEHSSLVGKSIADSNVRNLTGVNILGIKSPNREMLIAPSPATHIGAGDVIVALGKRSGMDKLKSIATRKSETLAQSPIATDDEV